MLLLILAIGITGTSVLSDTTMARMLWGFPGRANGLIYYFSVLITLFVGLKMTIEDNFPQKLYRVLNFIFTVNVIYGLIQISGRDPVPWNFLSNPIIGTFGNPNFAAAFLAIGAFFYFFMAMLKSGVWRLLYSTLGLLAMYLSVASQSIQGPAILLISLLIYFMAYLKHKVNKLLYALLGTCLATALVLIFLTFLGIGPLGEQFYQYTLKLRIEYWLIGFKTALNWPLTGVGTDSYVEGFKLFRTKSFIEEYGLALSADSAHSVPLNFLANFGFINFFLYLTLLLLISWKAISILSKKELLYSNSCLIAIIWLSMVLQSLFSLEQIGLSALQWCVGGLLLNKGPTSSTSMELRKLKGTPVKVKKTQKGKNKIREEFKGEITFGVIAIVLLLMYPTLREDAHLRRLNALSTNSSSLSDEFISDNFRRLSYISKEEHRRGRNFTTLLINAERYSEAETFLKNILLKDGQSFDALKDLIVINSFTGDLQEVIDYRVQLQRLAPLDTENVLELAKAYASKGKNSLAIENALIVLSQSVQPAEIESASALIRELRN